MSVHYEIQPFYKLIECWVQKYNTLSPELANLIFTFTAQLISKTPQQKLDRGIAGAAFIALKNIANLERRELIKPLSQCTRSLLRSTDINRAVNNLFVIGLLSKIASFEPDFLEQIVRDDLDRDGIMMSPENIGAIVVAIAYTQGKYSPLLNEMAANEKLPQTVKTRILREQEK